MIAALRKLLSKLRGQAHRLSGPDQERPLLTTTHSEAPFRWRAVGSETQTDVLLQDIVESVVHGMGFKGAMVAVVRARDGQDVLSVRAVAYSSAFSRIKWFDAGKELEGTALEIGQRIAGQKLVGNYVPLDEGAADGDIENLGVRVIREGRPFARTDSLYDLFAGRVDRDTCDKLQALAHLNSFVTLPFKDGAGNLIGNMFAGTDRPDVTDQEIASLTTFAKMAAIAIQNARLLHESEALRRERQSRLDELQRKNSQLQALQDTMGALLESTLIEDRLLQRIVDGVVQGLGFRAAMLAVIEIDEDGERILPIRAFSIHPSLPGRKILTQGQKLIGKQLVGSYVYVNDEVKEENLGVRVILDQQDSGRTSDLHDLWYPAARPRECAWVQRTLGIRALATVPFWLLDPKTGERKLIGNLHVGTDRQEITDGEVEVLRTFALQASNAIRNAEMYLDTQRVGAMASLTSNMAHRLNGIIGKLSAWTQQIQSRAARDELDVAFLDNRLQRMNDNLAEAAAVVERVREKAKEEVRIASVDVNQAVRTALKSADVPLGISVEQRLDERLPAGLAVRQHLIEALRVLISNAVSAMGDRGRLTITSRRAGDVVEISVEDTGGGIPDEMMDRLFTLGGTTKKRGLGYGLWWARTSLSWVEGDIRVQSDPGKGSTFTVTLPVPEETLT